MFDDVEDLLYEIDQLISNDKIAEAKSLLYEVLQSHPDYGKAHNYLGWIFHYKMIDYEKAERHYKLALKYAAKYPPTYVNYSYFLIDKGKYKEMLSFGLDTLEKENIDKGTIYNQIAKAYELRDDLIDAYANYKNAKTYSLAHNFIEEVNASIHRVQNKMNTFQKIKIFFK